MAIDPKPAQFTHSTTSGSPTLAFLRQHPLWGYFLLAFGLSWLWEFPAFIGHTAVLSPWAIPLAALLSPISAGLIMAWITEGRAGMGRLLLRCVLWRAGVQWYLVVLLFIPAILFLGILVMPRAIAAFRVPSASFLWTYLLSFGLTLVTAPIGEEPGWRGFALPRLQTRYGPLLGTLILGSLWVLWHLPYWLLVPGWAGFGTGLLGFGVPFVKWAALVVAVTIVMTWVCNHSSRKRVAGHIVSCFLEYDGGPYCPRCILSYAISSSDSHLLHDRFCPSSHPDHRSYPRPPRL